MCDQEERVLEHKMCQAPAKPAAIPCDQCNKLMPRQSINENLYGTGWNVCDFCVDKVPDFVWVYISRLEEAVEK